MSDEIRQPWEQREDESTAAYEAFTAYLVSKNETGRRSIDRAWRATYQVQDSRRRSDGGWNDWSGKFDWVARAEAKDAWERAEEEAARSEERRKVAARLERRRLEQAEIELRDATALRGMAGHALKLLGPHLLPRKKRRRPTDEERVALGMAADEVILEIRPAAITLPQIAQALKIAGETERMALNMSQGKAQVELSGPNGGPIRIGVELRDVRDDELDILQRILERQNTPDRDSVDA